MSSTIAINMAKSIDNQGKNKRKGGFDNACLESVPKKRKIESLNWDGQGEIECVVCKRSCKRFKTHLNNYPECEKQYDTENERSVSKKPKINVFKVRCVRNSLFNWYEEGR